MYLEVQEMNEQGKIVLFVPGRLCLFGEHSDWAGTNRIMNSDIVPGCAIVSGTEQGIYAEAEKNTDFFLNDISGEENKCFECPMDVNSLRREAHLGGFYSYAAGVASYICEWYHVSGVKITITKMDLPMKKGLSSSAAICVLVAKAFNELYDLRLNTMGIMNIAYWGEQRTPSRCGRLDQACAFGTKPVALFFDGNEISVERIPVKKPLFYVFADLNAGKNTVKILADLNSAYPFAKSEAEKKLHEALGEDNRQITDLAMKHMAEGNSKALGELMTKAQALFDRKVAPMSPDELSSPVLHSVLNDETVKQLTYGAKGVGSQGDGTVQLLAKDEESQRKLIQYLSAERGMTAYPLTLKPQCVVRKAIIPVAGFGTRLYPETRFVKKEFCPVVDRDGLIKPILLVLLEELDRIGIEEICIILNPEEQQLYDQMLFTPISDSHYFKLPDNMKKYEDRIQRIIKKIQFAYQNEPKGFGHAVFQASDFAGDDPVLLLLGDTIYNSNSSAPCTQQLVNAYEMYGCPTIALQNVKLDEVCNYGIFSGDWEDQEETTLRCRKIMEKPNSAVAKDYLSVPSKKNAENYYAAFGAYVLTKEIFDRLDYAIANNIVNSKGEVELTDALAYISENRTLIGYVIDGKSYDLGNAEAYRKTVSEFGLTQK